MPIDLIRKLQQFTALSEEDRRALEQLASLEVRQLGAKEDLVREGDRPQHVHLILEGWACRYKVLEDGRGQIAAFLVPGDIGDLRMFIVKQMDHSLASMTPIRVAEIPSDLLLDLTQEHPRVVRALWWNSLVEEAIAREWIVNNSQRDATERVAHLFCELFMRLRGVGLTNGGTCEFPLTQAELGETTGLSTVHVNRTLQDIRAAGLIMLKGKTLTIPNLERLQRAALFNPNYLHLERDGRDVDVDRQPMRRPARAIRPKLSPVRWAPCSHQAYQGTPRGRLGDRLPLDGRLHDKRQRRMEEVVPWPVPHIHAELTGQFAVGALMRGQGGKRLPDLLTGGVDALELDAESSRRKPPSWTSKKWRGNACSLLTRRQHARLSAADAQLCRRSR